MMRRAFTMIELLVATMLLAMLVTILTMMFNQSSIAWTTGLASVTGLGNAREQISIYARNADNVILDDSGEQLLRIVSVWDENGNGGLKQTGENGGTVRTIMKLDDAEDMNKATEKIREKQLRDPLEDTEFMIGGASAAGRDSYIVGVTSYGPDGKTGGDYSWDDISTMPEVIVK